MMEETSNVHASAPGYAPLQTALAAASIAAIYNGA